MSTMDLIRKLAAAQDALLDTQFLAPRVSGSKVSVRVDGMIHSLAVTPNNFVGWGLFEVVDAKNAILIDDASLPVITRYMKMLRSVTLRLMESIGDHGSWWAWPENQEAFLRATGQPGPVVVHLVDGATHFDAVRARFDGRFFWFEDTDRNVSAKTADVLREALESGTAAESLRVSGMTPEHRATLEHLRFMQRERLRIAEEKAARAMLRSMRAQEREWREKQDEIYRLGRGGDAERIRNALQVGGGQLISLTQNGDAYNVRWRDRLGRTHTSSIMRDQHTVRSAGAVCLSGMDSTFDLESLVGIVTDADDQYFYY